MSSYQQRDANHLPSIPNIGNETSYTQFGQHKGAYLKGRFGRNGSKGSMPKGTMTITHGEQRESNTADHLMGNPRRGSFTNAHPSTVTGGRVVTASLELRAQQDRVSDYLN